MCNNLYCHHWMHWTAPCKWHPVMAVYWMPQCGILLDKIMEDTYRFTPHGIICLICRYIIRFDDSFYHQLYKHEKRATITRSSCHQLRELQSSIRQGDHAKAGQNVCLQVPQQTFLYCSVCQQPSSYRGPIKPHNLL